jgi:Xaa-Pro aminopeptidase
MDHAARVGALAGTLDMPLLVNRPAHLRYLLGFTGSNGFLLVNPGGDSMFVTDGRYGEAAEPLVSALDGSRIEVYTQDLFAALDGALGAIDKVLVEAAAVTWEFVRSLAEKTSVEPAASEGAVERLRRVKDGAEVDGLRAAAEAGDAAFTDLDRLAAGAATERDLAWALIGSMRQHGGDPATWDPIVAAGAGASVPHHESGDGPLGGGLLLLDYGCTVDGYHSDMSRTVWVDGEPDPEMARVHRAVAESQQAAIEVVVPGTACGDIDAAARGVLASYGYEQFFLHSTGHGVGLEIHEEPWIRRANEERLEAGNVITIEPGVYLPGIGGVRIEDMVLVADEGPVLLTESSRELIRQ